MTEHSINRSDSTESTEDQTDSDPPDANENDRQRSDAEVKRDLRRSVVGQAILNIARRRQR